METPQLRPLASLRKHLPSRKASARHTKSSSGLPEFEMLKPAGSMDGIVISITEGRPSTSTTMRTTTVPARPTTACSERCPQLPSLTIPPKAVTAAEQRPGTPPSPLPSHTNSSEDPRATSPAHIPLPRSSTNTPTLIRSSSNASSTVVSPIMRSMFPRYNPTVPLAQQQYYPDMAGVSIPANIEDRFGHSPYISSLSNRNSHSASYADAGALSEERKESPLKRSESLNRGANPSEPQDLVGLWSIANGQDSGVAAEIHTLELSCDNLSPNHEIITFNSGDHPIYALEAKSAIDLTISRIHPENRTTKIPICASTLAQPTRQDSVISTVFPKLAGLMALDQSSSAAVANKLDRNASKLAQAEAIQQAQEREASLLLWDCDSGKFCIMHPTLLDQAPTSLPIEIIPTPTNPEKITIFAPETRTPLLVLSLPLLTLTVHSAAITALPSLYILDTLMISLLTLLLHLHRSCGNPSSYQQPPISPSIPSFPPPPPSLHSSASRQNLRRPRAASRLSAFRSTRSIKSTRSLHSAYDVDRDLEMADLSAPSDPMTTGRNVKGEKAMGKQWPPTQIFATDDPALGRTTRMALKLLYWIFEIIFWILGVMVQVMAAGIVGAGKFISKL